MRALSLFSGCGGGDLGLLRAGCDVVAHCEIEPHAQAVLRYHYPDVPLHDDVTTLDGSQYCGAVDLVVGGSPCQDLSVAGQRAGLAGERSGLFHEQVRVWEETQALHILWENVLGALSSNAGRDFAVVLGAIVGGTVPVPSDGWRGAGVVAGPGGVAAWRVLDLQYFGPPQRRRRVFVWGSRAGGVDPAEVLLEPTGVRGDPAARREAWQGVAAGAGGGVAIPLLEPGKRTGVSTTDPRVGSGIGEAGDPCYTLQAGAQHGVVAFDTTQITSPLNRSQPKAGDPCHPLAATAHPPAIAFDWQNSPSQPMTVRPDMTGALRTRTTPAVAVPVVLASGQANAERSVGGVAPTLTLLHEAPVVVGTLESRNTAGGFPGTDGAASGHVVPSAGAPRRLMPIECERLQGWPDHYTRHGRREDGSVYELSDSARYRVIGNGIGAPVTHWIGLRALEAA